VHPNYLQRNVTAQQADPDSLFNFTKKLLRLRKDIPALRHGEFIPMKTPHGVLGYLRRMGKQFVLVAMNFSNRNVKFQLPKGNWQEVLTSSKGSPGRLSPRGIQILLLE
jgi:glycosidase